MSIKTASKDNPSFSIISKQTVKWPFLLRLPVIIRQKNQNRLLGPFLEMLFGRFECHNPKHSNKKGGISKLRALLGQKYITIQVLAHFVVAIQIDYF